MPEFTDPAAEFALACRALSQQSDQAGANWLASQFETEAWTEDFYRILFAFVERGHALKHIIDEIDGAEHIATQAKVHITDVMRAFRADALSSNWKNLGSKHLSSANINPILMLSGVIRPHLKYPKLSDQERDEILDDVEDLILWLEGHQLAQQDFIRQCLINGLKDFRFRLERIKWLGSGYTIEGLKEVISSYLMLERGWVDDGSMPIIDAALHKVMASLKSIYEKVGFAKEIVESGDFLVRAYGAASIYSDVANNNFGGLLSYSG